MKPLSWITTSSAYAKTDQLRMHDILTYCRTKREFMMKSEGVQKVWVTRFIKRCKNLFIIPALPTSTTVQPATGRQGCETTPPLSADQSSENHSSEGAGEQNASEQDAGEQDASEQEESDDEYSEDDDSEGVISDKEDHQVDQIGKASDKERSLVQPSPAKRRYSFRSRSKTAKFNFSYPNEEIPSFQEQMSVSFSRKIYFRWSRVSR
ncbi:hypothetical protein PR003_g23583 [Phytophthora rubi]|uniref:Uncharacterized protein n=1 Tax=Phytophthora rubi TaxID=129364 RepID=A0A6A3KX67_9STRA|nr:hypothetical protein PR001_g16230 [Phytophthora rubi]KAE9010926.1 hypothetical protein PR002_g15235 [Phytophthora rubi]KAE9297124.1 hypothetical protein PR003_g23583 [Phytophthora rubi]